jgi:hypothetical protein
MHSPRYGLLRQQSPLRFEIGTLRACAVRAQGTRCQFVVTTVDTFDESMHDTAALLAVQIDRKEFLAALYPGRIPAELAHPIVVSTGGSVLKT